MHALVIILVVIAALLAIASGIWVAIALLRAVTAPRTLSEPDPGHDHSDKQCPPRNPPK